MVLFIATDWRASAFSGSCCLCIYRYICLKNQQKAVKKLEHISMQGRNGMCWV